MPQLSQLWFSLCGACLYLDIYGTWTEWARTGPNKLCCMGGLLNLLSNECWSKATALNNPEEYQSGLKNNLSSLH